MISSSSSGSVSWVRETSEWYIKVWGNEVRRLSFARSREFARLVTCFPNPKYNKIAKILPRLADPDALWQLDGWRVKWVNECPRAAHLVFCRRDDRGRRYYSYLKTTLIPGDCQTDSKDLLWVVPPRFLWKRIYICMYTRQKTKQKYRHV